MKKKHWYKFMYVISTLLVVGFIIRTTVDYIQYNETLNSAPFYVFILARALVFLLPAIVSLILASVFKKKFNK